MEVAKQREAEKQAAEREEELRASARRELLDLGLTPDEIWALGWWRP